MALANRKSIMTLYIGVNCPLSHRARIVLTEKSIPTEIREVNPESLPEDLVTLNPYGTLPTIIDRDLVLYNSKIIMEYLDERFPHPPLMPVDPVSRAKTRLMLYRIDRDWYSLLPDLQGHNTERKLIAQKQLRDSITSIADFLAQKPYFMSDDYTLVDCSMAPLLWRLSQFGIDINRLPKPIGRYAERIFKRESFRNSLSEHDIEMSKEREFA